MGEAERRILDPRAPVILTAKVSREFAEQIFANRDQLSFFLLEASTAVCCLMVKLGLESVKLNTDELLEGRRLASHITRNMGLDGALTLSLVGQHEQTEHEGPPGEPNGAENQT